MKVKKQVIGKTLADVTKLYIMVAEMRVIVARLREADVEVRFGGIANRSDPLCCEAVIHVQLRPGCDRIEAR